MNRFRKETALTMKRICGTLSVTLLFLFTLHCNCEADELVVSLSVEAETQSDKRVIVFGETNLPPGTSLMVGLEDAFTGESRGQTKTNVLSDGTFKSEALGPKAGLQDGHYLANVTMPIARVQSEPVRQFIGETGQKLKGPLVKRDSIGITVGATNRFSVGGEEAANLHCTRLKNELLQYKELRTKIKESFALLERSNRKVLLDDDSNLANLSEWGAFALSFRSNHATLQRLVDEIDSTQARFYLRAALGDVGSMFHDAAFKKNTQYLESKSSYLDSLKRLDVFIGKRETIILKTDNATQKRSTVQFRTWTDVTGKHKVLARLISVTDNVVILEKKDGNRIDVPLRNLSQKDRTYANDKEY